MPLVEEMALAPPATSAGKDPGEAGEEEAFAGALAQAMWQPALPPIPAHPPASTETSLAEEIAASGGGASRALARLATLPPPIASGFFIGAADEGAIGPGADQLELAGQSSPAEAAASGVGAAQWAGPDPTAVKAAGGQPERSANLQAQGWLVGALGDSAGVQARQVASGPVQSPEAEAIPAPGPEPEDLAMLARELGIQAVEVRVEGKPWLDLPAEVLAKEQQGLSELVGQASPGAKDAGGAGSAQTVPDHPAASEKAPQPTADPRVPATPGPAPAQAEASPSRTGPRPIESIPPEMAAADRAPASAPEQSVGRPEAFSGQQAVGRPVSPVPASEANRSAEPDVRGQVEAVAQEPPASDAKPIAPSKGGVSVGEARVDAAPPMALADQITAAQAIPETSEARAPVDSQELMRQVVRQTRQLSLDGRHELHMRLQPPALGHLRVQVVVEEGRVTVQMLAESPAVKGMLEANLPQLQSALTEQGLRADRLMVLVSQTSAFFDATNSRRSRYWEATGPKRLATVSREQGWQVLALSPVGQRHIGLVDYLV